MLPSENSYTNTGTLDVKVCTGSCYDSTSLRRN